MPDIKKTATALSLTGVISAGGMFAMFDQRYAQASDVDTLVATIQQERVERIEFMIGNMDTRIRYINSIPEGERTTWEHQQLLEANMEKEFLLRKLERLNAE